MIIRMSKIEIIGPKEKLLETLDLIHNRGVFQPDPQLLERIELTEGQRPQALVLDEDELRERTFFSDLHARLSVLIELLPKTTGQTSQLQPLPVMDALNELANQHLAAVRERTEQLAEHRQEVETLQRDLSFWKALEPLTHDLPTGSNLELFGIAIRDAQQLEVLENLLHERTLGRCHVSSTLTADGALVGLIATTGEISSQLREALTSEHVPELSVPEDLANLPIPQRVTALSERLATSLARCRTIELQTQEMSHRWLPIYQRALAWLEERLDLYRATATVFTTQLCFIIQGWMAKTEVPELKSLLTQAFDGCVVLEQQAIFEEEIDQIPVKLCNPGYFAPFEIFSRLLPLPKYSSYDPTPFIGLFFPVLFGMILGDLGYGLVLLVIAVVFTKRFPAHHLASDLGKVLGVAALYACLFGLLYGELFGDLGKVNFGLEPLWFDRGTELVPMIVFSLTVGVVHILLGSLLGVWSHLRRHQPREALIKLVMLLAILLLVLAAVGWFYPHPWLATRPLLLSVAILLPILIAAEGLLAPLEMLKTLGNIISYVRIMAIGLCSVLLAMVANQLGGMTGDILVGTLVAGVLHGFNLLLGVFAPTVHSLRLHYVEFFSKFLDLGGRRFEPWHK